MSSDLEYSRMIRKRKLLSSLAVLVLVLATPSAKAQQNEGFPGLSRDLEFELASLEEAMPPRIAEDHLILTALPDYDARYVTALFEHEIESESFPTQHVFRFNEQGVFLLAYPIPERILRSGGELRYRISIDGLWMRDPENPAFVERRLGTQFSIVSVPADPAEPVSPEILGDRVVRFVYRAEQEAEIFVAGTFNNWDPFLHHLERSERGSDLYEAELRVAPGTHYYYFLVDGERMTDPLNRSGRFSISGISVSRFVTR